MMFASLGTERSLLARILAVFGIAAPMIKPCARCNTVRAGREILAFFKQFKLNGHAENRPFRGGV
jgi:hypothetical protein